MAMIQLKVGLLTKFLLVLDWNFLGTVVLFFLLMLAPLTTAVRVLGHIGFCPSNFATGARLC